MSYPQPSSNAAVKNGAGFWRTNTPLASPGDIYETEQSALAFAIGPNSDIASAVAVYLDEGVPTTLMNQIAFSANRAVVGRIPARNDATYGPSGRQGRILLYNNNIYDPDFKPVGFAGSDTISIEVPIFDVIQYFENAPSLGPARVDRTYYFQDFDVTPGSKAYIVLPYYGRRYASLTFFVPAGGASVDVTVSGINYALAFDGALPFKHQVIPIVSPTIVAGASAQVIVTADGSGPADGKGMFDSIMLSFSASPCITRITFSDQVEC